MGPIRRDTSQLRIHNRSKLSGPREAQRLLEMKQEGEEQL
jgi:hypothetical protein